jgi:hypothetical protein
MLKVNKIVVLTEKELSELIFITVSGAGKQCSRQTEWDQKVILETSG